MVEENKPYINRISRDHLHWLRKYLETDENSRNTLRSAFAHVLHSNQAPITEEIIKRLRTYGCSVLTYIDKGYFPYPELRVSVKEKGFYYRFKGEPEVEAYLSILEKFLDDDEAKAINIFKGWVAEAMKEYIDEKRTAPK